MALVDRAVNIITKPDAEWPVVAAEPATPATLITSYVLPLAAIPAIATVIGSIFHPIFALVGAILGLVLTVVSVFVVGFIADNLAPSFGGRRSLIQGMKLAAYSSTPQWIAGALFVLKIIPILGSLIAGLGVIVAGLYGLYLLYLGTTPVMGVPVERRLGYAAVVILISIVVWLVVSVVVGAVVAIGALGAGVTSGGFAH